MDMLIKILIEITASSKNRGLILNSYYDLGQIYLSRSSDYDKSIEYFNFISNLKKESIIKLDTTLIKEFIMPVNE